MPGYRFWIVAAADPPSMLRNRAGFLEACTLLYSVERRHLGTVTTRLAEGVPYLVLPVRGPIRRHAQLKYKLPRAGPLVPDLGGSGPGRGGLKSSLSR